MTPKERKAAIGNMGIAVDLVGDDFIDEATGSLNKGELVAFAREIILNLLGDNINIRLDSDQKNLLKEQINNSLAELYAAVEMVIDEEF